jgi:hypothetical protein
MRFLLWILACALVIASCGKGGRTEHEFGVELAREIRANVCAPAEVNSAYPCGAIDVRYEASSRHVHINVYGITDEPEISRIESVTQAFVKRSTHPMRVTLSFFKDLETRTKIRVFQIGA